MIFAKMATLTMLFWLLVSLQYVHGQDQLSQEMYNAVIKAFENIVDGIDEPEEVYKEQLKEILSYPNTPALMIVQNTSSNMYILDICGYARLVIDMWVGHRFSYFRNLFQHPGQEPVPPPIQPSEIDTLVISCGTMVSFGYNISFVDSQNGTIIETVSTDKWSSTTLASLFTESPRQFNMVKRVALYYTGIRELTISDLMRFLALETLQLAHIPVARMEDGLLCYFTNVTILQYDNSLGYLTTFPQQIFNCTSPLKLEYIQLLIHSIAYLPENAFGSAVKQLKYIKFNDMGLEVVHKDAFKGLMGVEVLSLIDHKLSQMSNMVTI